MQAQCDGLKALVRNTRRKKLQHDLHDEERNLDDTQRKLMGLQSAEEVNEWPQVPPPPTCSCVCCSAFEYDYVLWMLYPSKYEGFEPDFLGVLCAARGFFEA